ncbi:CMRF35-like molecule 7 [Chelmon rostratus]|uniref:CMRF35-like molecule 7 n=1 Tax=Chelmon rostratus TaxID=109905 RepID=UPI001BE57E04|nr:CMRF35-like molecule 7 [Chelmon rostratus]
MIRICAFSCLLSALSVVEMKPLNIRGHVGETVTIKCSKWNTLFSVKSNVKYWCYSPCSEDKHVIVKAAFGETKHRNRIQLVNSGADAFVTFTNLQQSDSNKYYCGVDKFGHDSMIEVNLEVTEAESSRPKTTPKAFDVNTSTMSSSSSDFITDTSTSHIIHPTTTQGAGNGPFFIAGFISLIIVLVVVALILTRKVMKKQQMVVTTQQQDAGQGPADPDGVYQSLHLFMKDEDAVYSTLETSQTAHHSPVSR